MGQEIKNIKLKELVLWTENPRDPIDPDAFDQDIVDRALGNKAPKWSLAKLAKEMGDFYDYSELPTVVFNNNKPVVYDGNRRIILGKIKYKYVKVDDYDLSKIPEFPLDIPCNVCSEKIALTNVLRKHGDSGSWQPLERDIFLNKFMEQPKSTFLKFDENTSMISSSGHLNKRFVKDEIFTDENLKDLGFEFKEDKIYSNHTTKEVVSILSDLSEKIKDKVISTRKNRGKVKEVLNPETQKIIQTNNDIGKLRKLIKIGNKGSVNDKDELTLRMTKRKKGDDSLIFGEKLFLDIGDVSNLYRDILDLYNFYLDYKNTLSTKFHSLIRMSLRLLCETAAGNYEKLDNYIKDNFDLGKKNLTKDAKTTLSVNNVSKDSFLQLLHVGAHNYSTASNLNQTIAISLILGQMITITHGKSK